MDKTRVDAVCEFCEEAFSSKKELDGHRKTHFCDEPDLEPELKTYSPELKTYSRKVYAKNNQVGPCKETIYVCTRCHKTFSDLNELTSHESHHEQNYICQVCTQHFSEYDALKDHEKMHFDLSLNISDMNQLKPGLKTYSCKGSVQIHTRDIVCEICKEAFRTANELVKHNEYVHYFELEGAAPPNDKIFKKKCRISSRKKIYTCEVCGKTFRYIESLYLHCRIHGKKEPLFPRMGQDKTRKIVQQRKRKKQEVRKRFGSNSSIKDRKGNLFSRRHLKIAEKNNRIEVSKKLQFGKHLNGLMDTTRVDTICEFCEKAFSSRKELNNHRKTHFSDEPDPEPELKTYSRKVYAKNNQVRPCKETIYVCTRCHKTFPDLNELTSHESHHEQNYICQVCTQRFSEHAALKDHEKMHFDLSLNISDMNQLKPGLKTYSCKGNAGSKTVTNEKRHACGTCGESYLSLTELKSHELEHNRRSNNYKCQVCAQTFRKINDLLEHGQIHVGETFNSGEISLNISDINQLKPGLKTYSCKGSSGNKTVKNEKRHVCVTCNESFFSLTELKEHELEHIGGSEKFKCQVCGQKFSEAKILLEHAEIHIGEMFNCEICQTRFSTLCDLDAHLRIHSREIVCEICKQAFRTSDELVKHNEVHYFKMEGAAPPNDRSWKRKCRISNRKKVYSCEVCGKIFKYIERFYLHYRIHGKEEPVIPGTVLDQTQKIVQKRKS